VAISFSPNQEKKMATTKKKDVTVDGITLQLRKIEVFKRISLDRKLDALLGPVAGTIMSAVGKDGFEANIDMAMTKIAMHLSSMPESEYMPMVEELLSSVTAIVPGKQAVELTRDGMDVLEDYGMTTIYKIIFEVMKWNKFLPFDLAALQQRIGAVMTKINGLTQEPQKTTNSSESSEGSVTSPTAS
jgi:hypothetical protein